MFAALPLAWKVGVPIALVISIIGGYLAWQYHQRSIGREMERAEHLEALLKQQQEAMQYHSVGAEVKLQSVTRAMAAKDRFHARMREPQQEAVSNEIPIPHEIQDTPACVVSPRIVRDVNRWTRVLNDTAAERDDASGGADSPVSGAEPTPGSGGAGDGE